MIRRKPSVAARSQRDVDPGMGDAAEGDFGPPQTEAFPQHAGEFGDVGVGVRVVGAAPDHNKQGLAERYSAAGRCSDTIGRGLQQLRVDPEITAQLHRNTRIVGDETVHLPRQVVFDMTSRKQHAGDCQDPLCAAPRQQRKAVADRRADEFEITRGEIELRQTRAQRCSRQLEFLDRSGIAAPVSAQEHRRPTHWPFLPAPT